MRWGRATCDDILDPLGMLRPPSPQEMAQGSSRRASHGSSRSAATRAKPTAPSAIEICGSSSKWRASFTSTASASVGACTTLSRTSYNRSLTACEVEALSFTPQASLGK